MEIENGMLTLECLGIARKNPMGHIQRDRRAHRREHGLKSGFGLIGLRERMQLLGGTLSAGAEGSVWTGRAKR